MIRPVGLYIPLFDYVEYYTTKHETIPLLILNLHASPDDEQQELEIQHANRVTTQFTISCFSCRRPTIPGNPGTEADNKKRRRRIARTRNPGTEADNKETRRQTARTQNPGAEADNKKTRRRIARIRNPGTEADNKETRRQTARTRNSAHKESYGKAILSFGLRCPRNTDNPT